MAKHPFCFDISSLFLHQLKKQANLTSAVDVVPLPAPSDFAKPGTMCWAAGWGRTGLKKSISRTLREVELRIMGKKACKIFKHYKDSLQICVGSSTKVASVYMVSTHLLFLPSSGNSIRGGSVPSISLWQYPMPVFLGCYPLGN